MKHRIAHMSDLHIDERSRFEETSTILDWLVKDIDAIQASMVLIAGDSFPVGVRPSTPLERMRFYKFTHDLTQTARKPAVIIIRGNHDIAEHDLDIFHDERNGIYVFSQPDVQTIGGITVGVLPYPTKGNLVARMPDAAVSDIDETCRRALEAILNLYTVAFKQSVYPTVLTAHLNVAGSDTGGFRLIGQDVEVSAEALAATGADYVALGHIHKHQHFAEGRVVYSGSPRRVDFGEEAEAKGYVMADVERGMRTAWEFRPTPTRAMQTITLDMSDPFCLEGKAVQYGAEVRVIIAVSEDARDTIDVQQVAEALGAKQAGSYTVEYRVTPTQRVRAPEIQQAVTPGERLKAYLGTLETPPDEETTARLLVKMDELYGMRSQHDRAL